MWYWAPWPRLGLCGSEAEAMNLWTAAWLSVHLEPNLGQAM